MALVLQTEFPVQVYVPYERPPQPYTLWTAIPRGMLSFVASAQLDLKPVNDTFLLSIPATLPPNYAYVMEGLHFNIVQDRATDWTNKASLNLQSFFRGGVPGLNYNGTMDFRTSAQDNQTRVVILTDITTPFPTFPMIAPDGSSGIQFNFNAWNSIATAAAAGTLNFYINFWQFDLEQIRKYPINSPVPVQSR